MRALVCLLGLSLVMPALAQPPASGKKPAGKQVSSSKFMRITRDAKGEPEALETAIVHMVPASGEGDLTVDLVSVVHVADRGYYDQINKQLAKYDVVLYELVAPQGTRIPRGGKRDKSNPLAMIQDMMKSVLELDSQVEQVDYQRKHFVHADLSPDQMAEAIRKRGDNGLTLTLSIAADFLRQANLQAQEADKAPAREAEDVDLLSLFLDPNGPIKMKRLMAEQFAAMSSPEGGLGKTLGTILIADRNQAALKVFQKEMAKGKKKIAIFYGAAHMPDFEKRLREEYGLKRSGEQWLAAWDLRLKKSGLNDLLKLLDR
jgi:hypothetical protein